MNISVFGLGYVGCVSLGCLAQNGHNVIGVDKNELKVKLINDGKATIVEKDIDDIVKEQRRKGRLFATTDFKSAVVNTEVSIIAVGTPSSENGHLELKYLFNAINEVAEGLKLKKIFHIIVIRSTVIPGTIKKLEKMVEENSGKKPMVDFTIISNPEFLREGTAVKDYYNPPYTLIGSNNELAIEKVKSIYNGINGEFIITDIETAEIMKYINNTFHALKVTFANEIGNICKLLNIDSHKVMDIFVKDTNLNISPYYLKPGFAYGGSCLPKDLKGLQTLAHDLYLKLPVIQSISESNNLQILRAVGLIQKFGGKNIGFLGFSFKEGTDDLRNSPTVILIETLLGKGFEICIFDRNVNISSLTGRNKEFIEMHIPHLSKIMYQDIEAVIEKSEILVLAVKDNENIIRLKSVDDKAIIDFIGINELKGKENYHGINW